MSKFKKFLKFVFTLGYSLYKDYKKEKSKTKVLIHNIHQIIGIANRAKDLVEKRQSVDSVALLLKPENIKEVIKSFQIAQGLQRDIQNDLEDYK